MSVVKGDDESVRDIEVQLVDARISVSFNLRLNSFDNWLHTILQHKKYILHRPNDISTEALCWAGEHRSFIPSSILFASPLNIRPYAADVKMKLSVVEHFPTPECLERKVLF